MNVLILLGLKATEALMLNLFKLIAISFLAFCIMSCSTPPKSESLGEYIDSSTLTARVKANLIDSLGTDSFAIKINTYKDFIQLSGFVRNKTIKNRAYDIALSTPGAIKVRNDLIIK